MKEKVLSIMITIAILIAGISSLFMIAPRVSSIEHHQKRIEVLDQKATNVLALTTAVTATSVAITMIPDDVATPIANELADLSVYFVIINCAILLEKYLLTILGTISFSYIIPFACLMILYARFRRNHSIENLGYKLIILAVAIYLIVPVSIWVSNQIDSTFYASIQETIETAKGTASAIQSSALVETDSNLLSQIWNGFQTGITNTIQGISDAVTKVKQSLGNFIEAIAVMIVTSCMIPLIVLVCFMKIINMIFHTNFSLPSMNTVRMTRKNMEQRLFHNDMEKSQPKLTNNND